MQLLHVHCNGSDAQKVLHLNHAVLGKIWLFMTCQVDYYREICSFAAMKREIENFKELMPNVLQ